MRKPAVVLTLLYCLFSVAQIKLSAYNVDSISGMYSRFMRTGDYKEASDCAEAFRDEAYGRGNMIERLLSDSYVAQARLAMDDYSVAKRFLDNGFSIWDSLENGLKDRRAYQAFFTLCNGMGIWQVIVDRNYEKAIGYFFRGMEAALRMSDNYSYALLGSNMVVAYNLRQDIGGLKYALDIYDYGKKLSDEYIIYTGAYVTSMMYFLKGDIEMAEKYIKETVSLADKFFDKMGAWCLYADILSRKGDRTGADGYYRTALKYIDGESVTTAVKVYLSYGEFLIEEGEWEQAAAYLEKGINLAESKHNSVYLYRLYELASMAYERIGDYSRAFEMFRCYHDEISMIDNIEQERAVNSLIREYENERHEKELQRKEQALLLSVIIIAVILTGTVTILGMYRHRNRLYKNIVKQYKEAVSMKYARSSMTDDEEGRLFKAFNSLMEERKLYREKNLTKDRVADILRTNRTYLSQVINGKTGMSVLAYINKFRIEEAIERLSDADDAIPLKALSYELGFNSITTFYKLFSEKTGMTPAKYREKIMELS